MRRVPFGLIVPALLIGLVGVLATLQYRWLGKVSEAEREQLRRSLDQRARIFAEDFDAEVSRLYLALQPSASAPRDDWRPLAAVLIRWREGARFPGMVRAVYLVDEGMVGGRLRTYDTGAATFGPPADQWPPHLERVRARLTAAVLPPLPSAGSRTRIVSISTGPVIADIPALLIPIASDPLPALPPPSVRGQAGGAPEPGGVAIRAPILFQSPGAYLLVDLDGDYIRRTMLPALVAQHFPEHGNEGYGLTVLSAAGAPLFVAGGKTAGDVAKGDVTAPFFTLRLDVLRQFFSAVHSEAGTGVDAPSRNAQAKDAPPSGEGQRVAVVVEHRAGAGSRDAASVTGQLRIQHSGWTLVLRHPAGSVDAAVLQARRRNLWLSFGILGVLAAGLVLVVVNGRRTAQLAARQMDFVASVSHELRTPLAVIRSAAQNLSAGVVANAGQARRYGQLIEDEGRRLTDMVEQILEYSRIHGDRPLRNPRPLDARQLLGDAASSFADLATQAGVTLEIEAAPDDLPAIVGDEAALRRAVHNLIGNALKYAAEGRWIGLATNAVNARGKREVRIAVSDRGPGIAAADLAHVFEPFYRGQLAMERQVHGNGLGLTLVKRIAEVHGGTVTVESAVGEGSVFTLHLPATPWPAGEMVSDRASPAGSQA